MNPGTSIGGIIQMLGSTITTERHICSPGYTTAGTYTVLRHVRNMQINLLLYHNSWLKTLL